MKILRNLNKISKTFTDVPSPYLQYRLSESKTLKQRLSILGTFYKFVNSRAIVNYFMSDDPNGFEFLNHFSKLLYLEVGMWVQG